MARATAKVTETEIKASNPTSTPPTKKMKPKATTAILTSKETKTKTKIQPQLHKQSKHHLLQQ